VQCSELSVPLVYSSPTGPQIKLALKRRPTASKRRQGSLLVNPGGPGLPGTSLVDQATLAFSDDLLQAFDIVSWDPRGTGKSDAVDCVDDLDPFFGTDPTPDTPAEKQQLIDGAKTFQAGCKAKAGDLLAHVSTQDTVRDMDMVRAALGEDKATYFGFSYGSELGATYATMFPERVRAMVLDGAADPNAGFQADAKSTAMGLDRALSAVLDDCAKHRSCPFYNGGQPQQAFDQLMASLDSKPIPSNPGRPSVGQGVAYYAVLSALYDESYWPLLTAALAAAQRGDGSPMLAMYDDYLQRNRDGTWTNTFEDLIAISCVDDPGPQDLAFPDTFAAELSASAPRFGAFIAYSYTCMGWPAPSAPPLHIDAKGAPAIVVIGTTGDPVTPLEASRSLAEALEKGVLVTVEGTGHTGYMRSSCAMQAADDYLIDLKVPPAGLVCK